MLTNEFTQLGSDSDVILDSYGQLTVRIYAKLDNQYPEEGFSVVTYQSRANFTGNYIIAQNPTYCTTGGTGASFTTKQWHEFEERQDGYFPNGETVLETKEGVVVYHDNNGDATIEASAYFYTDAWGGNNSGTARGTISLPSLQRSSKIDIPDGTTVFIGDTLTLPIISYVKDSRVDLVYEVITNEGTSDWMEVVSDFTGKSYDWVIPESLFDIIISQDQATINIYCITENEETGQIGAPTSVSINVQLTYKDGAIVTATIEDLNGLAVSLTGSTLENPRFVKGASNVQISYNITPQHNATITKVELYIGDTGEYIPLDNSILENTYLLNRISYTDVMLLVTDSRTIVTSYNFQSNEQGYYHYYELIPYTLPTIVGDAVRGGNTSNSITMQMYEGNFWNGDFGLSENELTVSWYVREYSTYSPTEYTYGGTLPTTINGNTFSGTPTVLVNPLDTENGEFSYKKTYEFALVVSDKLSQKQTGGIIVTRGIPVANWEEDTFNFNVPTTITEYDEDGNATVHTVATLDDIPAYINPFVYSTNEQEIGTWIDGKKLYRRVVEGTLPSTTGWTSVYTNTYIENIINIGGYFKGKDGRINWFNSGEYLYDVTISFYQSNLQILLNQSAPDAFSNCEFVAILEYTKGEG